MKFYVTFGQRYHREPHPSGLPVDPDAVIEIEAEDMARARALAWATFKGQFHQVLTEERWEAAKEHFPHGIVKLILTEGHDGSQVEPPSYLGDSVYLERDSRGIGIVLTTRNGLPTDPSNTIFLEWGVYEALKREVARLTTGGKL